MNTPRDAQQQGRANLRLALVLASLAALFCAGFVAKIMLFNH